MLATDGFAHEHWDTIRRGRNSTLAKIVHCSALRLQTIKNAAQGPKYHAALSLGHRLRFVPVIVALCFRSVATVVH
jgi:hypothetical protein